MVYLEFLKRDEIMFYAQIFNNYATKKAVTKRYGPSTGNTWEQVMSYAQFLHAQYNIRVFVKIFDEDENNGEVVSHNQLTRR